MLKSVVKSSNHENHKVPRFENIQTLRYVYYIYTHSSKKVKTNRCLHYLYITIRLI